MKALTAPLSDLAEYEDIVKNLKKEPGVLRISGCIRGQRTHLMYALSDGFKYKVIACSSESKAKEVYEEYAMLDPETLYYPPKDFLFYQADIRSKDLLGQRMKVFSLLEKKSSVTVVTSFDGFMDYLATPEDLEKNSIRICADGRVDLEKMSQRLTAIGYEREAEVSIPGQFAVRGGIIDIFPLTEEYPVRIELWGDEVDSIRIFEVENQRSQSTISEVCIYPATEFPEGTVAQNSFLDYFPAEETILFLDEPARLLEKGEGVEQEFMEASRRRIENGYELSDEELHLFGVKDIVRKINRYYSVGVSSLDVQAGQFKYKGGYSLNCQGIGSYNRSFELLVRDLKRMKRNKSRVLLLSGSRTRARRLAEDLRDNDLTAVYCEDTDRDVKPGEVMTAYGYVSEGYEYPMIKFVVIAETDIFGKEKKKKKKKIYEGRKIHGFTELKPGDYVVHETYGLGVYEGIEKIEIDKISKDYMKIRYEKGSNLYIPATQLDLIQKYASSEGKKPKLNRLGGQEWNKTRTRVQRAVKEIAGDLVRLYAARQNKDGYVYGEDTVWQREFEEMFPFEETRDQLLAIEAVKKDMESSRIMDRLICGDVGYGKTEIAIRAAFKAVQENRQVAYLVPTTILAQQHYNTFVQRMKDYPVRIDLLCRFRTAAQQKKTIEDLKKGMVDIVIGTHRILSDDVRFKNLGLLVIDEEQRFGVQHKEKIKQMQQDVDALVLTATPIPRTLHMSLIGIRDMSVLEEAPEDRLPIQTYVMEYSEEIAREAMERELARDGQVYFVYNRVEDIVEFTGRIQRLVPDAVVAYAHGQMKERELERIMYSFISGEIDVLVSTTIIETGLDIPNVNTMIIFDADKMGLSQLYQLRGRVGRSNRMAYAFLFYRRDKLLKEIAEKRLVAIREFTDLGSGFKIAMRDLELRGAGNILGAAQHGHMEAVGYDLYCKMLNEAVRHLKGETATESFATTVDLNVDAFIPEKYIPNELQKLDIYKRIAAIENNNEKEEMLEELIDRFGDPPKEVQTLLAIARLKAQAHEVYVSAIEQKGETILYYMYEQAKICPERIPQMLENFGGELGFRSQAKAPYFFFSARKKGGQSQKDQVIESVKKVLDGLKGLID